MIVPSPPQANTTSTPASAACCAWPRPSSSSRVSSHSGSAHPAEAMYAVTARRSSAMSATLVGLTMTAAWRRSSGSSSSGAGRCSKLPPSRMNRVLRATETSPAIRLATTSSGRYSRRNNWLAVTARTSSHGATLPSRRRHGVRPRRPSTTEIAPYVAAAKPVAAAGNVVPGTAAVATVSANVAISIEPTRNALSRQRR